MPAAARLALLLVAAASPAAGRAPADPQSQGNGRPYTPALTCAAVRDIVARRRSVVLATSPMAYEMVHLDSGACQQEVTGFPAFVPTLDDPNCFSGYRCRQRTNDGGGSDSGGGL